MFAVPMYRFIQFRDTAVEFRLNNVHARIHLHLLLATKLFKV
jgi:hypothetical protein